MENRIGDYFEDFYFQLLLLLCSCILSQKENFIKIRWIYCYGKTALSSLMDNDRHSFYPNYVEHNFSNEVQKALYWGRLHYVFGKKQKNNNLLIRKSLLGAYIICAGTRGKSKWQEHFLIENVISAGLTVIDPTSFNRFFQVKTFSFTCILCNASK